MIKITLKLISVYGYNFQGLQIKTGNPFTVLHSKRECVSYCSKYFKICMMVEAKHKNNPPKPLSHNIFFTPMTPRIGYVWLVYTYIYKITIILSVLTIQNKLILLKTT